MSEEGFLEYLLKFDICCLTETFTSLNFDFTKCFDDHVILHSPGVRLSGHGRCCGGVVVILKKTLADFTTKLSTHSDNIVAFRLCSNTINETLFITVYIPPSDSPYYAGKMTDCNITVLEDVLITFEEQFPKANIVICGDLNARIGQWNVHTDEDTGDCPFDSHLLVQPPYNSCSCFSFSKRKSQDNTVNSFGKILKSFCKTYHCTILNGCTLHDSKGNHTYVSPQGESVVDYCMLIAPQLNCQVDLSVGTRAESDHMPLELHLGRVIRVNQTKQTVFTYSKLQWNPCKLELFRKKVESPEFDSNLKKVTALLECSIEEAIAQFSDLIKWSAESLERQVRVGGKRVAKPSAPWFDSECREIKRKTVDALKNYRRFPNIINKERYLQHRRVFKDTLRSKKKGHYEETRSSLMKSLSDSNKFWSIIKKVTRRSIPHADISLDSWKTHFESLFRESNTIIALPDTTVPLTTYHALLDAPFSSTEIKKAFRKLSAGKAPGIDHLPGGCLKEAQEKLTPFLTKLFNNLFDNSYFPKLWSKSVIVPIHKKGDFHNPDNYRGISLLCATCKLFTTILADRLRNWMESESKLCIEQAGFRAGHSTIDHIFTLHAMILKHVYGEGRGKLYVCFVDYRKAFDSVNHTHLWRVLQESGVSTKFLAMLKAIYTDVQSCVRWQHVLSDFFPCSVGVKQGAVESPGIFSLFINVVAEYIRRRGKHGVQLLPGMMEVFLLLFADDVVLISSTPAGLQNQINNLVQVSNSLQLVVNTEKTKIMVFRKGGHLAKGEQWFLDGIKLETVNRYKYLGVVFTTKLSLNSALDDLCVKGKQKTLHLLKAMWSLRCLKTNVFFRMFDTQVVPTLLYGAEVWGLETPRKIETVHMFASKRFLGLDTRTPNHMVYGDLGRFPLYINACVKAIRYWLKLTKMDSSRLPKQAYIMLQNSNIRGKSNWARTVKDLLQKLGFGYVWINGGVNSAKYFANQINQRLRDWFIQEWSSRNNNSDRFRWYSTFKLSFGLEDYLNNVDIKKFRDILIRFRFSINDLAVNRFDNNNPDLKCPFCDHRDDEEHFLLECKAYEELRQKYLRLSGSKISKKKFCISCLKGYDCRRTRNMAMYIFYAMKLRKLRYEVVGVETTYSPPGEITATIQI